jgi:hypothetical protein
MTRIALFQSTTGIDPAANLHALEQAIREAAEGGAEMLFTPEMSGLLDRDSARAAKNLRSEGEDAVLAACREAARRHRIWLHLGSLAVLVGDGKVANRAFVIDREGEVRATYDKLHLFDVDLPTGESWRSSTELQSGSSVLRSATTCASRPCSLGSPKRTRTSSRFRRPSRFPPERLTGTSFSVRARSRPAFSWSPQRKSVSIKMAVRHTVTRS